MTSSQILIVEDEKNLGDTLKEYLCSLNFSANLAKTAKEAREEFNKSTHQIVLMDIDLPDGNGLELGREFRNIRKDFVLLFLSAMNDPDTKVQGLEIGAEDYITKPFALKELTLRLERILKSKKESLKLGDRITHGTLTILFGQYVIIDANGTEISLSQKECEILKILYINKNHPVTRDEIIEKIWGEDKFPTQRTVDNYIVKLRRWAETDPSNTIQINSVRSVGYKLIVN